MSETFDEADFGEPPLIWTNSGESRMPKDIWEKACHIVKAFRAADDGDIPADPDDFLRTMISTELFMERKRSEHQRRN